MELEKLTKEMMNHPSKAEWCTVYVFPSARHGKDNVQHKPDQSKLQREER